MTNPSDNPTTPRGQQQLAIARVGAPSFLDTATVIDDTPLWIAWEAAQNAWLESKRRRSGGDNTVRAYSLAVRQFFDWSGVEPWRVSPGHAQEWAVYLSAVGAHGPAVPTAAPLAQSTVGLKLAALSSLYDYVQRRYTFQTRDGRHASLWPADKANPFGTVERPKISQYGRATYPTTPELKAILAEINTNCLLGKRDFALLYTFSTTCRRASEVLNMRWGDLRELGDGNWAFDYRYKGGDQRQAVLDRRAYAAICAYLQADGRPIGDMQAGDYIWIPLYPDRIQRLRPDATPDPNRPISNHQANQVLKKYARRCDIDPPRAHIHGLRHAGARLRVEQMRDAGRGVDYMELKQLLGHSSLAVTQIYSEIVLEDPEDPGGDQAAQALLPTGPRRRRCRPQPTQEALFHV